MLQLLLSGSEVAYEGAFFFLSQAPLYTHFCTHVVT